MSTVLLPITLASAGAAAIINVWIALRVGGVRRAVNIATGDGGNPALIARMRAHANFVEYTPFVLILLGLIEYNIGSALWLWIVSAVYLLGRIAHPFGMDGVRPARTIGTATTLLILLGLGIYAAALPFTGGAAKAPTAIEAPAKG
jgi:uncharacterized membrane protein YecN with MAPEG domain